MPHGHGPPSGGPEARASSPSDGRAGGPGTSPSSTPRQVDAALGARPALRLATITMSAVAALGAGGCLTWSRPRSAVSRGARSGPAAAVAAHGVRLGSRSADVPPVGAARGVHRRPAHPRAEAAEDAGPGGDDLPHRAGADDPRGVQTEDAAGEVSDPHPCRRRASSAQNGTNTSCSGWRYAWCTVRTARPRACTPRPLWPSPSRRGPIVPSQPGRRPLVARILLAQPCRNARFAFGSAIP
jgi:hypothetical protein